MKRIISALTLIVLLLSACCKPEPKPEPTPTPVPENSTKVEFIATPQTFSAQGGKGIVEGRLKEISPEGKLVTEIPLPKSDYSLSLKSGDASQIKVDSEKKEFTIAEGTSTTFELEATVTTGKAIGQKQVLTLVRGGEISYHFEASPVSFTALGGEGSVVGTRKVTDASGSVVEEKALESSEFYLLLKRGETIDIAVNDALKSFSVKEGNSATFELEAVAKGSTNSQIIEIKREGSLTYTFEAIPNNFTADGGKGKIKGSYQIKDILGKLLATKELPNDAYTLTLKKGNTSQITIDEATKSFEVKEGEAEETFVLEVKPFTTASVAQEIIIHRDAKVIPKEKLPLEYVAEYNVNPEGTGIVSSHATNASGYFSWSDAVDKFSNISINGKDYHLPSKEEWLAIVPSYADRGSDYITWEESSSHKDVVENVVVAGKNITSKNDYLSNGDYTTYALRFKGGELLSAWKYEYPENPEGGYWMKISCCKADEKTTIEAVSKSDFWSNSEDLVIRYLPACGYYASGVANEVGDFGNYWTSTPHSEGYAYGVYFYYGGAGTGNYQDFVTSLFAIRLFEGK